MKFLKYLFRILVGLFAIIGVLATIAFYFLMTSPRFFINIGENEIVAAEDDNVELLKQSSFKADTVQFHFAIVQDSARAQEIRNYFKLDTLYSPNATTWEKAVAISKFVATNIPHDQPFNFPEHPNAIDLWKYSRDVNPGFNCRMHAILNYELLQAAGLTARFVTCMPQDKNDGDCHVVNEVWLPELGKWAFIDSDMDGHYCTDQNGTPLNLLEMRDKYAAGEQMLMYPGFKDATTKHDYYYCYMAKNTYWFSSWETLHYFQEDRADKDFEPGRYVNIVPEGFTPFGRSDDEIVTTDAKKFWTNPEQQ